MATIEVNPSVYFECPVCMEDIDDSWKMLPCQHIFCLGCLRKLYHTNQNQNPTCPTCRQDIMVSLEHLQKPRLLYEMYENLKTSRNSGTTEELDHDLIAAVQLSISDLRTRQEEIDRETERLEIALCKSAEEAIQKAEIESLSSVEEMDLIAAIELSIRENAKRSSNSPSAWNVPSDNEAAVGGRTASSSSQSEELDLNSLRACDTNVATNFGLPDFNEYLKTNGNAVLNTILTVSSTEEELHALRSTEIISYLKIIDRYLNTLKHFRSLQVDNIIQKFGKTGPELICALTLEDEDDEESGENSTLSNKDKDLVGLLKDLEVDAGDDTLLKITLKKSEILEPLDMFRTQFLKIKRKLENALINAIKLESCNQATPPNLSSPPHPHILSAMPSRSLILPVSSSSSPHSCSVSAFASSSRSLILPVSSQPPHSSISVNNNRSLILPLPSNSIQSPTSFSERQGCGSGNYSYQRGRDNRGRRGGNYSSYYRSVDGRVGGFRGSRGGFNGNRGFSSENCGRGYGSYRGRASRRH